MTCLLAGPAGSKESLRVVVLPFDVYSQEDLSYMGVEIPGVILKQLSEDGAGVVDVNTAAGLLPKEGSRTLDAFRRIGIQTGADYVVWGSLTWIGTKFSMDAKMVEAIGERPPETFFTEGDGIENLFGTVKELAQDIGSKIFKWKKIIDIRVDGNNRIEADAIRKQIQTKSGDLFQTGNLSKDLKAIYSMGYFDDVRILSEDAPGGKIIIFNVKEKATIRYIRTSGNRVYDDGKIKENLTIKTGSILNIFKIHNNIERIEALYRDKNYHNVRVTYDIQQRDNNQADLTFVIDEGAKIRIEKITFIGNNAYSEKDLKGLMQTSEKGFFFWLTSSGELNKENLNQDAAKLAAFYHNKGYVDAKIGEPQVEFKDTWIEITFRIEEGAQYGVGAVDISGDLILPKEDLLKKVKILNEKFYNREIIRNDVLYLSDLYSDEGYAYANISPAVDKDPEKRIVNIIYQINKGRQVYFERILIGGNTKTRDKVIRRELQVYEQELYSGSRLKRGVRNLYRLDYFEDIKVATAKGDSDDSILLKIDVTEKPTGAFTFGGGYSSLQDFFVTASITQRNFLGRGQTLKLQGEIGGRSDQYTLSFTEPWLFDIPLSAGFDIYSWNYDYDTYEKDSLGGALRFSYRVFDFTRAGITYKYDRADISDITEDAADSIKELEGINITSSITTYINYDSRDRQFNPTEGSDHSLSFQYAGLGGNIGFSKITAETGWYIPLFWGVVNFLHGKAGSVTENSGMLLPDYEKFYLGGMNSMRGFDWRGIHAIDENGDEIGGEKFVQFNFEILIPLVKKQGLVGVLFYDTGNVYGKDESMSLSGLRQSAGYGIRWFSPIGPIRLENGYIIDTKEGERSGGRWEFTMGSAF
ncbi:MAG: outer membrane protein assembly factor BamA [Desulfobacterales bacterium]|nr:outer membrane protein assembly factor BamA [Desulfobacterales bacterium]